MRPTCRSKYIPTLAGDQKSHAALASAARGLRIVLMPLRWPAFRAKLVCRLVGVGRSTFTVAISPYRRCRKLRLTPRVADFSFQCALTVNLKGDHAWQRVNRRAIERCESRNPKSRSPRWRRPRRFWQWPAWPNLRVPLPRRAGRSCVARSKPVPKLLER